MTMKKSFTSFTKLAGLSGPSREGPDSNPITDFIKTNKARAERRRRNRAEASKDRTNFQSKRSSHNDLRSMLYSNGKMPVKASKRSSTTDLLRMRSSKPSNSNLAGLEEKDMDDILNMVRELKGSSQGKKLLTEFVDYQTGKSTRKPRILEGGEDDDVSFTPPAEIVIGH